MMGDEPTELDCSVVGVLILTALLYTFSSLVSGDKPYMMGDEPTELDCSVVGVLSTFKWALKPDNPVRKMIEGTLTSYFTFVYT